MNRVSPRLLDWWIAYYRVEPYGLEWDQAAGIAFQMAGCKRQLAANAGVDVGDLPPLRYADFMPPDIEPLLDHFNSQCEMTPDEMTGVFQRASR